MIRGLTSKSAASVCPGREENEVELTKTATLFRYVDDVHTTDITLCAKCLVEQRGNGYRIGGIPFVLEENSDDLGQEHGWLKP